MGKPRFNVLDGLNGPVAPLVLEDPELPSDAVEVVEEDPGEINYQRFVSWVDGFEARFDQMIETSETFEEFCSAFKEAWDHVLGQDWEVYYRFVKANYLGDPKNLRHREFTLEVVLTRKLIAAAEAGELEGFGIKRGFSIKDISAMLYEPAVVDKMNSLVFENAARETAAERLARNINVADLLIAIWGEDVFDKLVKFFIADEGRWFAKRRVKKMTPAEKRNAAMELEWVDKFAEVVTLIVDDYLNDSSDMFDSGIEIEELLANAPGLSTYLVLSQVRGECFRSALDEVFRDFPLDVYRAQGTADAEMEVRSDEQRYLQERGIVMAGAFLLFEERAQKRELMDLRTDGRDDLYSMVKVDMVTALRGVFRRHSF